MTRRFSMRLTPTECSVTCMADGCSRAATGQAEFAVTSRGFPRLVRVVGLPDGWQVIYRKLGLLMYRDTPYREGFHSFCPDHRVNVQPVPEPLPS